MSAYSFHLAVSTRKLIMWHSIFNSLHYQALVMFWNLVKFGHNDRHQQQRKRENQLMVSALYPMGMGHVKNHLLHQVNLITVIMLHWLTGCASRPVHDTQCYFKILLSPRIIRKSSKVLKNYLYTLSVVFLELDNTFLIYQLMMLNFVLKLH